jgi:alpha-N-arabinofuranosidase
MGASHGGADRAYRSYPHVIRHSKCVGLTLGKYGDEWDNRSESAEAFVRTIERALAHGWAKGSVGHHVVRDNDISHCEQAGIVGSMGAAFSRITGNSIHDINVMQQFWGYVAVDVEISRNHIYRTEGCIWLDWMLQGTRVTGNLLHDNRVQDISFEVDHGPVLVDNNLFLSGAMPSFVSRRAVPLSTPSSPGSSGTSTLRTSARRPS